MNTTDTAAGTPRADTNPTVSAPVSDTAKNTTHDTPRWPRRWPIGLLAAPAGIATWSGWVGLGGMTGFGKVHPLPGIADSFTINSAITLPIGVEAYAAYAMTAWLTSAPVSKGTRKFARRSAIAALVLGMLGQVAYHLLESNRAKHAPWLITTAVACLPVLVLGAGASLAHMLHRDRTAARDAAENTLADTVVDTVQNTAPAVSAPVSSAVSDTPQNTVADTARTVSRTVSGPAGNTVQNTARDTAKPVSNTPPRETQNTPPARPRTRPAARGKVVASRPDLARKIYGDHVREHGEPPAVAELMRQLKDAGHPTGNKTAAALLAEIRERPFQIAQ